MKYNLEAPFRDPGGKLSKKHSQIVWKRNKYGTYYTCVPDKPTTATANMMAQRQLFTNASAYAKAQMQDTTKRTAAEQRWASLGAKFTSLRSYLMSEFMHGNEVE